MIIINPEPDDGVCWPVGLLIALIVISLIALVTVIA